MKYCTYCGTELQDEVKFCPNCGKPLETEHGESFAPLNEPEAPAYRPASPVYPSQTSRVCPPTYLLFSILTMLFCCLPFGIVGLINSASVNSKFDSGDIEGAEKASRNARTWSIVSLCCGLLGIVIYIVFVIIWAFTGSTDYLFT